MPDFRQLAQTIVPHPCSVESMERNWQHLNAYMGQRYQNAQWVLCTVDESAEDFPFADGKAKCNVDKFFDGGKPIDGTGVIWVLDTDSRFSNSLDGARGYAVRDDTIETTDDDGNTIIAYRAVYFEMQAFLLEGDPTGDITDAMTALSPPPYTQLPPAGTTIENPYDTPIPVGGPTIVIKQPGLTKYIYVPLLFDPQIIPVVTDVTIESGSAGIPRLCIHRRNVTVAAGAELPKAYRDLNKDGQLVDAITGALDTADVIDEILISGDGDHLQVRTITVFRPEEADRLGPFDVIDLIECP